MIVHEMEPLRGVISNTMSTIRPAEVVCSNCGVMGLQLVLLGTSQRGEPDVDLRPPDMMRSMMSTWLQECASCGLVAPRLDDGPIDYQDVLKSPEYLAARSDKVLPPLTKRFICRSIIVAARHDPQDAFH